MKLNLIDSTMMTPEVVEEPSVLLAPLDSALGQFNDDDNDVKDVFGPVLDKTLLIDDDESFNSLTLFEGLERQSLQPDLDLPIPGDISAPPSVESGTSDLSGDFTSDFLDLESFINSSFHDNSPAPVTPGLVELTPDSSPVEDTLTTSVDIFDHYDDLPWSVTGVDCTDNGNEALLVYEHATGPTGKYIEGQADLLAGSKMEPLVQGEVLSMPETVEVLDSGTSVQMHQVTLEEVIALTGIDLTTEFGGDCAPDSKTRKRTAEIASPENSPGPKHICVDASLDSPEDPRQKKVDERRRKNNIASKISRASRRSRHKAMFEKEAQLEKENAALRLKIEDMTKEAELLRKLLIEKLSKVD